MNLAAALCAAAFFYHEFFELHQLHELVSASFACIPLRFSAFKTSLRYISK